MDNEYRTPEEYQQVGNENTENAAQNWPDVQKWENRKLRAELENGKRIRRFLGVLCILTLLLGLMVGAFIGFMVTEKSFSKLMNGVPVQKLVQLRNKLDKEFLFGTEDKDFGTGVLRGYMDALEDPYSVYYTPEEYASMMESTSGYFSGIGVVVTTDDNGSAVVVRPYKGSPGEAAGLLPDDVIVGVDGEDITGMDLSLVVTKIKGEEGTSVHLRLYRPSEGEYYEVDVVRARIETQTISSQMLDGQIGYIEMTAFEEVTYTQFMNAFNELKDEGMKALIIDIRNNGGGLLSTVTMLLDQLLPSGIITYTEDKDGNRNSYYSDENCVLDIPAAVLVNGYSASASEIFTGALKDYGKAVIVGTQTFGKGIVQVIIPLDDGSAVKYTTSRYYTPNGVCIHGIGVEPDIVVEEDPDAEWDVQLDRALEEMISRIGE